MAMNSRPHGRNKTVGSGSAHVGGGRSAGGAAFGSGGRRPSGGYSGGGRSGSSGSRGYSRKGGGGRLSLKKIIILAAIVFIAITVLKKTGGSDLVSQLSPGGWDAGGSYSDNHDTGFTGSASYNTATETVADGARDKFYSPAAGDRATVMIYMCGTDLESKYGMATKDLNEMLKADISDDVNVIVMTGGCKKWQNKTVSSACNQIYKIGSGKLTLLQKNAGKAAMTSPDNLTDFICFCAEHFPAERNMLIMWDHGGGSVTGFGYDEKNAASSSMTLAKISSALENAKIKFDFIGFDACLMATLENALVCAEHADYLIASEETEPGTGWYYTDWLSKLSADTSVSTVKLGKAIVDGYVSSCGNADVTLSVTDLAELQGTLPGAFRDFSVATTKLIRSDGYPAVADARAGARLFSPESRLNQVDLTDFADRLATKEAKALADVLRGCVKYNRTTMSRCYGLSIYFPYESTSSMSDAVASYRQLGMDSEYTKCIQSFASLETGGQTVAAASQYGGNVTGDLLGSILGSLASGTAPTSPIDVLLGGFGGSVAGTSLDYGDIVSLLSAFSGRTMPAGLEWVDTKLVAEKAGTVAKNFIDPADITASTADGRRVLKLTDEQWALVETLELNVFAGDGERFYDLGYDNVFEWDKKGNLLLEYDGTWLTLNGNVCAYYLVSDTPDDNGEWTTTGRIPALLNGAYVGLNVVFDDENPQGTVTGAYPLYEDDETAVRAKGNVAIKQGDRIELIAETYDEDGNYTGNYTLGDAFTVPAGGLYPENLRLDADSLSAMYRLTDIYGNRFWISID